MRRGGGCGAEIPDSRRRERAVEEDSGGLPARRRALNYTNGGNADELAVESVGSKQETFVSDSQKKVLGDVKNCDGKR